MTTNPTRRALLAGAGAAVALPGAIAPAGASPCPDADLIRLCGAFDACEMRLSAIFNPVPDDYDEETANAEAKPNYERMSALLDRMEAAHATTPEGILARARTLGVHAGEGAYCMDIGPTWAGRLVAVLLRDALALSGLPIPAMLLNPGSGAERAAVAPVVAAPLDGPSAPYTICTKPGRCPCADPCYWGRQAVADLQRDGWPFGAQDDELSGAVA